MPKEEFVVQGVIKEALPGAEFIVELTEEGMQGHTVRAHVSGKMRMNYIRILPGDTVTIVMTPYDLTKGRITYRAKGDKASKAPHQNQLDIIADANQEPAPTEDETETT